MADDADVTGVDAQGRTDFGRGGVVEESEDDDAALPLPELSDAAGKLLPIDGVGRSDYREIERWMLRFDGLHPGMTAAHGSSREARGAEHERCDAVGVVHLALAELLQCEEQNSLGEVFGANLTPQMA